MTTPDRRALGARRNATTPHTKAHHAMKHATRILTITAATVAAGLLSLWLAQGLLGLLVTCSEVMLRCTSPGDAHRALGVIGAGAGFWFAYTGRLARLFAKV